MTYYVVARSFRAKGNVFVAGDVITDPAAVWHLRGLVSGHTLIPIVDTPTPIQEAMISKIESLIGHKISVPAPTPVPVEETAIETPVEEAIEKPPVKAVAKAVVKK